MKVCPGCLTGFEPERHADLCDGCHSAIGKLECLPLDDLARASRKAETRLRRIRIAQEQPAWLHLRVHARAGSEVG